MKSLQVPYASNRTFQHPSSAEPSSHYDHKLASSPRRSPIDSLHPGTPTSITSRATAFFKRPRLRSASSVHSSDSASHDNSPQPSNAHYSDAPSIVHPFSSMVAAPVPVVSNHDTEDERDCPVCLEPLSFSFRLPGEKPHIVPDCGHALHEACFTAVYGPPPSQSRAAGGFPRKSNLGVCGVCRRPMKVSDGDTGKSNKLAALTGMGERNTSTLFPGRETPGGVRRTQTPHSQPPKPFDPTEDDPIEHNGSIKSNGGDHAYIVAPSIQVRPEFSTLTRTHEPSQPLTCIVVIELPSRRTSSHVPGPVISDVYRNTSPQDHHPNVNGLERQSASSSTNQAMGKGNYYNDNASEISRRQQSQGYGVRSPSPNQYHHPRSASLAETEIDGPYDSQTALLKASNDNPFKNITEDLRARIIDWKGHPLSGLGPLQMFDLLCVRRDALVREFFVYLFKEAIICVEEEKKRSLGRLLGGNTSGYDASGNGGGAPGKGVLKLKGRIYIRHIKQVTDTSVAGELSLTIDMEDERLESFILIFKDRSSLEAWKANISGFVAMHQQAAQTNSKPHATPDVDEFGNSQANSKAMRMLSGSTATTSSSMDRDSLLNGNASIRSSSTSHGSILGPTMGGRMAMQQHKLTPLGEDEELYSATSPYDQSPTGFVTPHLSTGPSNSLTPIVHPPIDLILVISLPPPTATPSTAALKNRVIKNTLDFVLASLGPKDRLSFVTFEVGPGGRVRKTPFLSPGRGQSRQRLLSFINEIGVGRDVATGDEFLVRGAKEEKTDVVTAVNHGLDVVLQRKARNHTAGMLLVSDAADSTRRAQMDLVLARAEAANVPIHSFGYGRSHDPASLWLMSNHTGGTYTFVKDWYDLRDCIAGCVGGLMSIGILNMKLHLKIVDGHRFRIRKVSGGPTAIVASDGRDVDIEVGEVRYGEKKEMLVELELDNSDAHRANGKSNDRTLDATDRFVQGMGLDSLSLEDPTDLVDGMMDRMIDEVPVFEVDGAFFDPAAAKHVSRLAHPVLLTITLMPPSGSRPRTPTQGSDPVILRRRMELLASDMITRALVLVSRKNFPQAAKILSETRRILVTVLQSISSNLPPPGQVTLRNRKEILTFAAVRALQAILADLQVLAEALDENVEIFAHDQRNFGAQQAMILRDQKSWSGRTPTEKLFWTSDNSIELVSRSTDWVTRD